MIGRDGYPAGVPCWIDTEQPDPAAAIAFYGGVFGWQFEDRMPPGAPGRYAVARLEGLDVAAVASVEAPDPASGRPCGTPTSGSTTSRRRWPTVERAGGTVLGGAVDVGPAGRMAIIVDPSRCATAAVAGRHEPGCPDRQRPRHVELEQPPDPRHRRAVRQFYAAVFGWEAVDVDVGGGTATMWRQPGYGDFLEAREPGLRSRQAADGVPPGFADAIAWVLPAADGTDARWTITFAVDDTDAVVQRAVELGGVVRVAPFDAGPVRAADLADPQGAPFSINSYDPGRA